MEERIYKALVLNDYAESGAQYASLVKDGNKKIETRMGRLFSHRGDVVICCGKSSVTENAGRALCIVEIWKGRSMFKTDEVAACIEWHPNRYSLLLRNWRHFSRDFEYVPCRVRGTWQGLFDIRLPDDIEIFPKSDILPWAEPEESDLFSNFLK